MAAVTSPNQNLKTGLKYLLLILVALVFVFPIVFMVVSSLKPDAQLLRDTSSFNAFLPVGDVSLDNYFGAFQRAPVGLFVFNSIFVTVITVIGSLFLCSMAAFSFAFLQFRGKSIVLSIIIATLIVPFETIAVPMLMVVNSLPWIGGNGISWGWLNTYHVQIVPFLADALTIFLFVQFFRDLPKELIEAARHRADFGAGLCDGGDPKIPRHVQPVSLAAHGDPVRAVPACHGGPAILLPAQHRLGRGHGLSLHDHPAGSRLLPFPATRLHHLDRLDGHQGLKPH
jgi:ABC-type spermidine/putrescine transport system permease subunit II